MNNALIKEGMWLPIIVIGFVLTSIFISFILYLWKIMNLNQLFCKHTSSVAPIYDSRKRHTGLSVCYNCNKVFGKLVTGRYINYYKRRS